MLGEPPDARLDKVAYVFNFLQVSDDAQMPPILRHFSSLVAQERVGPGAKVLVRDLRTGQWTGPHELLTWGRGYACVSTDQGPQWLPARNVKPVLPS
uniref:Pol polyprotein n=1 Tax=Columba livia TaxID=8932 RepID=R7VSN7_COLLI